MLHRSIISCIAPLTSMQMEVIRFIKLAVHFELFELAGTGSTRELSGQNMNCRVKLNAARAMVSQPPGTWPRHYNRLDTPASTPLPESVFDKEQEVHQ